MPVYIDQTGRKISLEGIPQKIVSVVPSQTELLFVLGLNKEVIAITKFCVHPDKWFRSKTRVGGTKQLEIDLIKQLNPDLIIANKEENVKEQIEELEKFCPVWISDVKDLEDAYEMIEQVGSIVNKDKQAKKINALIKENLSRLSTPDYRLRTTYLIWQNPFMTVGGDTFINSMLEAAGFDNIFKNKPRYPETTIDELKKLNCQLILLSSEPFPFKQKHIEEIKAQGFKGQVMLVDGQMFSWYGSRLLKTPEYFMSLHNLIPNLPPLEKGGSAE
jgi:ABC-type Fe3+-hydroxamate transport system substrate-binding protein